MRPGEIQQGRVDAERTGAIVAEDVLRPGDRAALDVAQYRGLERESRVVNSFRSNSMNGARGSKPEAVATEAPYIASKRSRADDEYSHTNSHWGGIASAETITDRPRAVSSSSLRVQRSNQNPSTVDSGTLRCARHDDAGRAWHIAIRWTRGDAPHLACARMNLPCSDSVASLAGNIHSSRSSSAVTVCGVPTVVIMEK